MSVVAAIVEYAESESINLIVIGTKETPISRICCLAVLHLECQECYSG